MSIWRTCVVSVLGLAFTGASLSAAPAELKYNRDIRPIISENCFACHGPDSAARKASLRVDHRQYAVEGKAIDEANLAESELIKRIFSQDADEVMPPPESHKKLTAEQKQTLKRWVEQGAVYEPHWSFIAPVRLAEPAVRDVKWARNPIDSFILARLEEKDLRPAPEADRYTLIRRLSLDLTGLPPTTEQVEQFIADTSADAYEKLVDRLMNSKPWGEHRARYWLDAARYADTHGLHFDNFREMWTYRDWVINAFNENVPFDRFTVEQLAGDLLPNATLEQRIASGFNRCNMTTNEGGTIPEENLVGYTRDRTETTAAVFLGLTAGCAVCHDHKFDPFTQRNFYELAAFFNNTTQGALDGNIQNTPPIIPVARPEDRAKMEALPGEVAAAKKAQADYKPAAMAEFDKWLATAQPAVTGGATAVAGLRLHAPLNEGAGNSVGFTWKGQPQTAASPSALTWTEGFIGTKAYLVQESATVELGTLDDVETDKGFSYGAWVKLGTAPGGSLLAQMDEAAAYRGWDLWLEGGKVGAHLVSNWPADAIKVISKNPIPADQWVHVFVTYNGSKKAAGVNVYVNGVVQKTDVPTNTLKGTVRAAVPVKVGQRNNSAKVAGLSIEDVRIYGRALSGAQVMALGKQQRIGVLLAKGQTQRSDTEKAEVFDWWQTTIDKASRDLSAKVAALETERDAINARGTIAHVMQEKNEEAMAFVLHRGEYDQRRDPVKALTPGMLPPLADDLPRNRLGLARWLLTPEHPLTARVTVNRYWQEIFGTGLVKTSGDFGIAGELPSHPQLLDWLAVEFRESGWDIKRLFKLMVMSSTYRQEAVVTAEKLEGDPFNRLLSRGPRFRMDGEVIRDSALKVSGLLVPTIGGPSVKPYQPDGVWEAVGLNGSNTRNYTRDAGPSLYRRSLYTFWKRAAPPASMEIFNAPNREVCAVSRERTNTPLQALVTLNDVQFVEAARNLAQLTMLQAAPTLDARCDDMTSRVLQRPLGKEERNVVLASARELLAYYKANASDAEALLAVGESKPDPTLDKSELAGWTMLANQLLNLDEVLNK